MLKLGIRWCFFGKINHLEIKDLPEIDLQDAIVRYRQKYELPSDVPKPLLVSERTPETLVIYQLDEDSLTLVPQSFIFNGVIEVKGNNFNREFLSSDLPIFVEKELSSESPYGLFLNNSAKTALCAILSNKYNISNCNQFDFYLLNKDLNNSYEQLVTDEDSYTYMYGVPYYTSLFYDDCNIYLLWTFRILKSYEEYIQSDNLNPADEYLVTVLFRFRFNEHGLLSKEYKILDARQLFISDPSFDTYSYRGESVYVPKCFKQGENLDYSVYFNNTCRTSSSDYGIT